MLDFSKDNICADSEKAEEAIKLYEKAVEEQNHKTRLEQLNTYIRKKDSEAKAKQKKEEQARFELELKVWDLRTRIEHILEIANKCAECGISMGKFVPANYCVGSSVGVSYSEENLNPLHFIKYSKENKNFSVIGFYVKNGNTFHTDGSRIYEAVKGNCQNQIPASPENIQIFLNKFGKFEDSFYEYVDAIFKK